MALGQDILESILYGTTNVEPIRLMRERRRAMEAERMQAEEQARALANFQRQMAGEVVRGERGSARQEYLAAQETAKQKKREMEVWTGIMDDDRDPGQILSDPETYKKASKAGQSLVDKLMSARDAYTNLTGGSFGNVGGGAFPGEIGQSLSALAPRPPQAQGAQALPAAPADAFQPIARQVPGPLPPAPEAIPAPETLGPSPPALGAPQEPMDIQSALGQLDPITRSAILAAGPKGPELLLGMLSEREKAQATQERLSAFAGGGGPAGFEPQQYNVNPETGNITVQYGQPKLTRFVPKEGDPSRMIGIDERGRTVAEFPAEPQMVVEEVQEGGKVIKKVVNLKETAKGTTLGEAPQSAELQKLSRFSRLGHKQVNILRDRIMPGGKINRKLLAEMTDLPGIDPGIPFTEGRTVASKFSQLLQAAILLTTGAAAPESQMNEIRRSYVPSIGDGEETVKDKLNRMEEFLTGEDLPEDIAKIMGVKKAGETPKGGGDAAEASRRNASNAIARVNQQLKDGLISNEVAADAIAKIRMRVKDAGISTEGL